MDLFDPERMQSFATPKAKTETHDTQTIWDIYQNRPPALKWQSFGLWFAKAHCLKTRNPDQYASLENFGILTATTKRFIVQQKLNALPLKPLEDYNKAWTDKMVKAALEVKAEEV